MSKFPVYRFVKCDGYLYKNPDKWRIGIFDKSWKPVEKWNDAENFLAHKGKYKGEVDVESKAFKSFFVSSTRPSYEVEKLLDWGEVVHQECYLYKEEPFEGFLVEVRNLCVEKDFGPEWEDAVDVGVGTIPERTYIGKWFEKNRKVGKVYIKKNGVYRLVPIENIHGVENE